jgi:hypothetical protein
MEAVVAKAEQACGGDFYAGDRSNTPPRQPDLVNGDTLIAR